MPLWDNLDICKHKNKNKLIDDQIYTDTKYNTIFKSLDIGNTDIAKHLNNTDGTENIK